MAAAIENPTAVGPWLRAIAAAAACLVLAALHAVPASGDPPPLVPILVYHRFGPVAVDSMTVTTRTFEWQLRYLHEHGYRVIALRDYVDFRLGRAPAPPPKAVVITADDGHRSVYTEMLPIVRREAIPVTLFIYPSAISNADYALTWQQLRELQATGLFAVQSHTYWHPKFTAERRRRSPEEYERFAMAQLTRSRDVIARQLGTVPDMLAWPFGIFDEQLMDWARRAGYVAGFTIERRHAAVEDDLMALPRYLMTEDQGRGFASLIAGGASERKR